MKTSYFKKFLWALALVLVVWIAFPFTVPVRFTALGSTIAFTITSPQIHVSVGGRQFNKKFETKLGLDLKGGSHLVFSADTKKLKKEEIPSAIEGARNIIERRVNFYGVSEPSIYSIESGGQHKLIVDLPGISKVQEAIDLIGQTAKLDFRELPTADTKIATDTPVVFQLTKVSEIAGSDLQKATVQFDSTNSQPVIGLLFTKKGGELFAKITERNVGKPIGIFVDGAPIMSPPIVEQKITDGQAIIRGAFALDEAKSLAVAINSGALPLSIHLEEQRSIGPTLGREQIRASVAAGVVGLAAVVIFMIAFYGNLGLLASLGLLLYGIITLALFRAIPVVLTLPGIAGFILSIGMAVDSNILIFERIKEELRNGQSQTVAFQLGFGRAIDAIKDANITTLLVAFILFNPFNWSFFPQFGLVKGFALTLAIGVATSLFTGVVITKRLLDMYYSKITKA